MANVVRGDPENFVVHGFTFVRPPEWKWVWDEKRSKAGNLLELQGADAKESAVVYFWKFNENEGGTEGRVKAWKGYFHESEVDLHTRSSKKKVGNFHLTYVEIDGSAPRPPHLDQSLIGVIIKLKSSILAVRMSGRSKVVEDAKPGFREMIERAVKERAEE